MQPTNKLRFVEREYPLDSFYKAVDANGNLTSAVGIKTILQQWFENEYRGEWRDIPVEPEYE